MTLPSEKPATDVAAQCFLNALIRETTDWKLTEYPPDELLIPLDEQKSLHFRVAYFSPTQHHRFAFPARLVTASGSSLAHRDRSVRRAYSYICAATRRLPPYRHAEWSGG